MPRLLNIAADYARAVREAKWTDETYGHARREVGRVCSAMAPLGVEFLDPPDGSDVPLHEQVSRLVAAYLRTSAEVDEMVRECIRMKQAVNAARTVADKLAAALTLADPHVSQA